MTEKRVRTNNIKNRNLQLTKRGNMTSFRVLVVSEELNLSRGELSIGLYFAVIISFDYYLKIATEIVLYHRVIALT